MTTEAEVAPAPTAFAAERAEAARAELREIDGRTVSWFELSGGARAGAIGVAEGETVERAVRAAGEMGIPLVGELATSGADVTEGVAALHAWGRVARALAGASGVVPVVLAVRGSCVSGPAMVLGLADHVVLTTEAFAYVSGPGAVAETTGVGTDHRLLGGAGVHGLRTGLASLVVEDDLVGEAIADLLSYAPDNSLQDPPAAPTTDPVDRPCDVAAATVPADAKASYDVRAVLRDVLDEGSFLEVRERWAPSMVTGFGRLGGAVVGVVANQPCVLAGAIDIEASQKAARFVQLCDAFNTAIITFVDTPGFRPGKDLEWRGMIRHGAQLVHAYGEATVPRLSVVLRKAYGGAYIVMDSQGLGSDLCLAWPTGEVAVMGASGAVGVLHGRELAAIEDPEEREEHRRHLEDDYAREFLNPWRAARRGFVDAVVEPAGTRIALARALRRFRTKRERAPWRRHSNTPL